MRAPLVLATVLFALGIAGGAQRPFAPGDGPLVIGAAIAVLAAALWAAGVGGGPRGAGGHRSRVLLALFTGVGLLAGATASSRAARSCAGWLPADVPVRVEGRVLRVRDDRFSLRADSVRIGDRGFGCVGVLEGRYGEADRMVEGRGPSARSGRTERAGAPDQGGARAPTQRWQVAGRWWTPRAGGVRPVGMLLGDDVYPMDRDGAREHPQRLLSAVPARFELGLERIRSGISGRIDTLFGSRAPLAASLLLAERDGLDRDVRDRFARAGLSHLLAISGLHVGLVAGMLLLLGGLGRTSRSGAATVAAAGTVGYVLFLGAPYSAVRAALQIVLVLLALRLQRPARTEALMATAALILLAVDPLALYSAGFQMSFAGVAGLLVLRRPILARLGVLERLRPGGLRVGHWLADGLATSLAATLATAPIVAWHFGRVAPIGVLTNLAAIPLLAVTVPALGVALAADLIWTPAGAFLAASGRAMLAALTWLATESAAVGWASVPVPAAGGVFLAGALAVGYGASRRLGRVRRGIRGAAWAAVAVSVFVVLPLRPGTDRVEVHMLDVGQGDAMALRSPAGRWLLVDAGVATDSYDAGARVVVPYLSRRGVARLEGLILTHPDADHIGGAGSVLRLLRPRWIMDPGMRAGKPGYLELLESARAVGGRWVAARTGAAFELDGLRFEVLHPDGSGTYEEANDASVVLRVVYGEFEILLTGDAPMSVERGLVARHGRGLASDVLKVGHHGSATSTSPELLEVLGARVALVSAGRGNRYGHPHRAVVDRLEGSGIRVHRTDRDGTIVLRGYADGSVEVSTEAANGGIAFPFP